MKTKWKVDAKSFAKDLLDGINEDLKKKVKKIKRPLKQRIAKLLERELVASDTIKSVVAGQLRHEFGLTKPKAEAAAISIIVHMVQNIQILSKFNKKSTTVIINLLPIDKEFIDSIVGGRFPSYKRAGKGLKAVETGIVDWADWLITRGTQVVIGTHGLDNTEGNKGRSGGTIVMKEGGLFRVDPAHAGTVDDNFITRAIYPHGEAILDIVFEEIERD